MKFLSVLAEYPILKFIASAFLVISNFLFGELYTQALLSILVLFSMDFITGIAASYYEKKTITSRRMFSGVLKFTAYLIAISAGYHTDLTLPFEAPIFASTMIAFVGVTEFISILENFGRLGLKTPQKLLNQLKDKQKEL
jgi:toxin secretion/phage lysis holin